MILTRGISYALQNTNPFSFGMSIPIVQSIPTPLPRAFTFNVALGSGSLVPLHTYPHFTRELSIPNPSSVSRTVVGSILPQFRFPFQSLGGMCTITPLASNIPLSGTFSLGGISVGFPLG